MGGSLGGLFCSSSSYGGGESEMIDYEDMLWS
jgi:hypothetical protein